jgi:integrase
LEGRPSSDRTSRVRPPAGRRDRVAPPDEARQLIAAAPAHDRAIWATALYAGLRRGELLALAWADVDLDERRIHVARSWDPKEGVVVAPKSAAGFRSVPLLAELRTHLVAHRLRSGRSDGLVFGADGTTPFKCASVVRRSQRAWRDAGLAEIGLHECRHTFAALLITAGVNPKGVSTFMGHASISITLDRYGHLFPGSQDEAAALVDAYLARSGAATAATARP